ncbi:hypothetical protein BKA64DRAFT_647848 [Cadophora sp. MPI-SDFR-AT-0126]|nr:hypothetical protein BKA64DRAFT_647848 [Leotiomycetes sp. MPI-SDFR-AT-0126]
MSVDKKALYRRAARYCYQTAEEAREAIGHFDVPSFPINWNDPKKVKAAAILLERSRYLEEVLGDDDDEVTPPLPISTEASQGEDATAKSSLKAQSTKKSKRAAKKASAHQQKLVKLMGLNVAKTPGKLKFGVSKNIAPTKKLDSEKSHEADNATSKSESKETKNTTEPLSTTSRKIKIILKVGSSTRHDKVAPADISPNKSEDNTIKCRKRSLTSCEAGTECTPPAKKRCQIILKIMKK